MVDLEKQKHIEDTSSAWEPFRGLLPKKGKA